MDDELDVHLVKLGVLLRVEKILYETIEIWGQAIILGNYETEDETQKYFQYLKDNHIWGSRNAMETIYESLSEQLEKIQTKIKNPAQFKKAILHLQGSNEALNPKRLQKEFNYYPQQIPSRVYRAESPRRHVKRNKPRSPTKIQEILQIKAQKRQERLMQQERENIQQEQEQLQIQQLLQQMAKENEENCKLYQKLLREGVALRKKQALQIRLLKEKRMPGEIGRLEKEINQVAKNMALLNSPCEPVQSRKGSFMFDEKIKIENEFQIMIAKQRNIQPFFPYQEFMKPKSPKRSKSPKSKSPKSPF